MTGAAVSAPVDLRRLLQQLRREYGVRRVACEGGAELFRSLLELKLVDRLKCRGYDERRHAERYPQPRALL